MEVAKHLNNCVAAHYVCLVHHHQLKPTKPPVSCLTATPCQQCLLARNHHLRGPALVRNILGHLYVGIPIRDRTHLIYGLPHKLSHRRDDKCSPVYRLAQRHKDNGLARPRKQRVQRGLHATVHRIDVAINTLTLVAS